MKNSLSIMLIDNDSHVRDSLKLFFESSRIELLVFKSASEGLNSLKYQNVDVVIADYFLPDMDGVKLLTQVAKIHPHATRILMATIIHEEMVQEMAKAGICQFIEKPLTVDTLETIIQELETLKFSKAYPGKETSQEVQEPKSQGVDVLEKRQKNEDPKLYR